MNQTPPKRCTRCCKYTIKADGEGYDTQNEQTMKIRLGRICNNCKIVYLNPKFENYELIKDSQVGA